MKLERLHEYLVPVVATVVGMGVAAYTASVTGKGQFITVAALLTGVVATVVLMAARERIWMAIPVCWTLTGLVPVLPIPFSVAHLATLAAFGSFLLLKAFKIIRRKPTYCAADIWAGLLVAYVAIVFLRNPAGVSALGSDRIGGRPYFDALVGVLAYWVLARAVVNPRTSRFLPLFMIAGQAVAGVGSWITTRFPQTVPVLSRLYTGFEVGAYNALDLQTAAVGETTKRESYLMTIGGPVVLGLCSYFRPFTLVNPLHFLRFLPFLIGVYCILLSGFRNAFAAMIAWIFISSYLRRGWDDIVRIVIFGLPVLALIVAMQGLVFELPLAAQRAMSFLPGRWDTLAKEGAEGSTEWRVEMWKQVLTGDKYIQNKWLGDGFGFTQREYAEMISTLGSSQGQENMMMVGQVHSGPISAIRNVGFLGLVLFLGLMIASAWEAWRLARRTETTPYFPLTLMVSIPLIWEPIQYVFIFGGFDMALPQSLYRLGMLKMLTNSLDQYAPQEEKMATAVQRPPPRRAREFSPVPAARVSRRVHL